MLYNKLNRYMLTFQFLYRCCIILQKSDVNLYFFISFLKENERKKSLQHYPYCSFVTTLQHLIDQAIFPRNWFILWVNSCTELINVTHNQRLSHPPSWLVTLRCLMNLTRYVIVHRAASPLKYTIAPFLTLLVFRTYSAASSLNGLSRKIYDLSI